MPSPASPATPVRTIVHLSDTHILPDPVDRLHGVDTHRNVRDILQRLAESDLHPAAALFLLFVGTWLVPFQVTMLPNHVFLSRLGWLDALPALVVPHLGGAFGIVLLRQFMKGFAVELIDGARLDGASSWRVLWRVMVPNLRAPIATVAVLSFITTWSEYFWPLLVTSKMDRTVIQVGLQMFLSAEGEQWGALMAAASLATLPVLVVYVLFQRQVVDAFVRSGLR